MSRDRRSQCYKLAVNIEAIHAWYIGLPIEDQRNWISPDAIVKRAPKHLVEGKPKGDNRPPRTPRSEKKRTVSAREDKLVALLIQVITRRAKHKPDA